MDHIPGPIIATVAPRPASTMAISELPNDAKNIQTSTVAIVIPATGVQSPRRSSVPATAATRCGRLGANLVGSRKCVAPK